MTKLHMEKLFHQPKENYEQHNRRTAYDILQHDVYQYAPNTLVVLHGPQQSGKSTITKRLIDNINSSSDDYLQTIRITTCFDKRAVNLYINKHDKEPLLIIVKDTIDLQDIQHYFDLINDSKNKNRPPITIVLELKTL